MDATQVIKKNLSFFNKLWKDYKIEMKEIFCNYCINEHENLIAIQDYYNFLREFFLKTGYDLYEFHYDELSYFEKYSSYTTIFNYIK